MDDETVGCGGTIRKMASAGMNVTALFMTDGRLGDSQIATTRGTERSALEAMLVKTRKEEARKACNILGVTTQYFLDEEDARLCSTEPVRLAVSKILDEVNPDLVLTPFFTDAHADHKATARILFDVLIERRSTCCCLAYEVWTPLFPNVLVDISETAAEKRQALQVYQSQLKDNDLVVGAFGLNAYRHMVLGGNGLAEAFWMGSAAEYCALYRRHLG
jgi:LmbE family N-acetylglucosaminyl deacetylase